MIFLNRRREGDDPLLQWKVTLFGAGAVLALVGIGLGSDLLIFLSIAVLLGGVGLRLLARRGPGEDEEGEEDEEDEEGETSRD